jgi:predicted metal-binding membrane protein
MSRGIALSARTRAEGLSRPAIVAVLSVAAAGWWLSAGRMQGMDAGPGVALGALGWFAATWLVMMAAMMLPAMAPVVAAECFAERRRTASPDRILAAGVFVAGYLAVWALAGAAGYLALRAGRDIAGGTFAWHRGGRWLAAGVLAAAAAYQVTGTKRRWLTRCRAPLTGHDGQRITRPGHGARAGLRAGVSCLASSWALMAVLFALGAMSLVWMGLVAALIAAERLSPVASPARVAAAGALLVIAVGVVVSPGSVPGLVVPGSQAAQRAITRMGGMHMGPAMPAPIVAHPMSMPR